AMQSLHCLLLLSLDTCTLFPARRSSDLQSASPWLPICVKSLEHFELLRIWDGSEILARIRQSVWWLYARPVFHGLWRVVCSISRSEEHTSELQSREKLV